MWETGADWCFNLQLWTDAKSRELIATEYPWFLSTFDNYSQPIQRADAIRYFVLSHYGGVYIDLDDVRPLFPGPCAGTRQLTRADVSFPYRAAIAASTLFSPTQPGSAAPILPASPTMPWAPCPTTPSSLSSSNPLYHTTGTGNSRT